MTQKHFKAIAAIFAGDLACALSYDIDSPRRGEVHRVRGLILSMADYFLSVNERFNRGLFYTACGLTADGFLK